MPYNTVVAVSMQPLTVEFNVVGVSSKSHGGSTIMVYGYDSETTKLTCFKHQRYKHNPH